MDDQSATSKTVRPRLSPQTLAWARDASGFTPTEVAKSAGVTEDRYLTWETGVDRPTFRQLRDIANKLKRPLAVFYMHKHPAEPPTLPDFRTAPSGAQQYGPDLRLEIRKAERTQMLFAMFREELRRHSPAYVPNASQNENPEEVGARLRTFLNISIEDQLAAKNPANAYLRWREQVFKQGVLPLQFGVEREQALGFAIWHDFAPIAAVNSRQAHEAKTFTLLHELAHLAIRQPGVSDAADPFTSVTTRDRAKVEHFCNAVAAAILLPLSSPSVSATLQRLDSGTQLSLDGFRTEAKRFGVSKYALAFRLSEFRPKSSKKVKDAVAEWFALDSAKRTKKKATGAPAPIVLAEHRAGKGLSRAVLRAVKESRLGSEEAGDILDLDPRYLPSFGPPTPLPPAAEDEAVA